MNALASSIRGEPWSLMLARDGDGDDRPPTFRRLACRCMGTEVQVAPGEFDQQHRVADANEPVADVIPKG
jgi:hypothetical protein